MKKRFSDSAIFGLSALLFVSLGGCGGAGISGSDTGNSGGGDGAVHQLPEGGPGPFVDGSGSVTDIALSACYPKPNTTVSGIVYAPNGVDPIAGATIYTIATAPPTLGTGACQACAAAPIGAISHVNSDVNGNFNIVIGSAATYVVIELGHFRRTIPVSSLTPCTDNALTAAQSSFPTKSDAANYNQVPKIAVTTGSQDHMQNILLKLGLDPAGFDVYEGRNPVPSTSASESHCGAVAGGAGCTLDQLLGSATSMALYDIIFIDCRNSYESQLLDPTMGGSAPANIEKYLQQGGRLYIDDESFEYVEQPFPEVFSWEPTPAATGSATPIETYYPTPGGTSKYETYGDFGVGGKVGVDTTYPATINESTTDGMALAQWLTARGVALGSGGSFTAHGFLNYWAVMAAVSPSGMLSTIPGYKYNSTTWVSGSVMWHNGTSTASGTQPLCASFDIQSLDAKSCGRALYSSYHTNPGSGGENTPCTSDATCASVTGAPNCNSLGFCWDPAWSDQERILEYLVLQVGTCIKIIG